MALGEFPELHPRGLDGDIRSDSFRIIALKKVRVYFQILRDMVFIEVRRPVEIRLQGVPFFRPFSYLFKASKGAIQVFHFLFCVFCVVQKV